MNETLPVLNLRNCLRNKDNDEIEISEIESQVFDKLLKHKQKLTAKAYEGYRKIREYQRNTTNSTDESIIELLSGRNNYLNRENSNKNATLVTTQRDYMAGEVSKDMVDRFLLPSDLVQLHKQGIIHFHDADYFAQPMHNCCLINLEDILQNGTIINGVKIDKPHRLLTATTIATQVITSVTSSQYGGATISLTHLSPFVRDSYNAIKSDVLNEMDAVYIGLNEKEIDKLVMMRLKKEVEASVQTFNYQINSMSTTNGQSPFISVFMYLNETDGYKDELAMLIEEFLNQRILGMKNEKGVYVTQAFPKLIYALEEDNIKEGSKYYELTKLSAKCTAKRLVPDYISEKKMKELKEGHCFPCMG